MLDLCLVTLGGLTLLALFLVHNINQGTIQSIRLMDEADPLLRIIDAGVSIMREGAKYVPYMEWADAHGFTPELMTEMNTIDPDTPVTCAVWCGPDRTTRLVVYLAGERLTFEFNTTFEDDIELDTMGSKDAGLFPALPDRYTQAFDGADLHTLLEKHNEALAYLKDKKNLSPVARPEPAVDLITASTRRTVEHVQSLSLWKYRGAWWFLVRRLRMNNISIAEQFDRGYRSNT